MTQNQTFNTNVDWTGTPWYKKEFSHPERTIRIATSFSGIGAAEYALKKLGLKHKIVFACDTGERYLKFGYQKLAEMAKGLDEDAKKEFVEHLLNANKNQNKSLTFGYIYSNIFEDCKNTKGKIEIPKECIDILTKDMTKEDVLKYVNNLYNQVGKENNVKASYLANYNLEEENWHNDIRFLDATPYQDQVDIYVFGPPCQPFSLNGKRLGLEDTRGTLFYDAAKVIRECAPKVFIFENVKGLTNSKKESIKTWNVVKDVFESLGYDIHYRVLNAADYGANQARERLFCIGFKKETDFKFPRPIKPKSKILDMLDDKSPGVRKLTPSERLKYMGFDAGFKQVVSNSNLCHQCGNSIVVDVFLAIYKQMDITQYGTDI